MKCLSKILSSLLLMSALWSCNDLGVDKEQELNSSQIMQFSTSVSSTRGTSISQTSDLAAGSSIGVLIWIG